MRSLALQSGGSVTTGQFFFGLTVVLIALGIAAYLLVRQSDRNLNEFELTVRDQIRAGLDEVTGSVRIDAQRIREDDYSREELAAMLRKTLEGDDGDAPETLLEATRDIRAAIADAWATRTRDIPAQVLSLGEWAVTIAVFGTIAVFSGAVASLVSRSPTYPSLSWYLDELGSAGQWSIETVIMLYGLFPYADVIWALGFAWTFRIATALYTRPWLLVILLVAAAAGLYVLERRHGDEVDSPTLVRKRILGAGIAGLGLVWAIGAGGAYIIPQALAIAGYAAYGHLVAFALAFIVGGLLAGWGAGYAYRHLRGHVREAAAPTRGATALLGARAVANVLRPVAILAAGAYLVSATLGGHLLVVLRALADAPIESQVSALAVIGLLVVLAGWELRESLPEIRRSLVELWARERARTSAAMRGMPYVGVVFVFLGAYAWRLPLLVGLFLAVVAGIGFLQVRRLYRRARRRYAEADSDYPPVGSLLVEGHRVETIVGERYLLNIGGEYYAHEDVAPLLDTAIDVLGAIAAGKDPSITVEEWYAANLREFGLADYEETYTVDEDGRLGGKLPERARKHILNHLRDDPNKRAFRETLVEDACEDLPADIAETRLNEMILTPGLEEYPNGEVRLKRDIWARAGTETSSIAKRRVENAF